MSNYVLIIWLKKYISIFGKFLSAIFPFIIPTLFLLFSNIFLDFQVWKLMLAIFLFLLVAFITFRIKDFYDEYESKFTSLISVLEKDLQKKAEEIYKRPARMPPDNTQTDFSVYQDLITKIKTKGYLDIYCQNMGSEINKKDPLTLTAITPGMHQFFLVLNYPNNSHNRKYFRIYNEFMVREGLKRRLQRISTYRDFTYTIYYDLFPLLGNFSDLISEKQVGSTFNDGINEHYQIYRYNFKLIKQKEKEHIFRIRVFI